MFNIIFSRSARIYGTTPPWRGNAVSRWSPSREAKRNRSHCATPVHSSRVRQCVCEADHGGCRPHTQRFLFLFQKQKRSLHRDAELLLYQSQLEILLGGSED